MAIYADEEIKRNWLYAPVMREINALHNEMGKPKGPDTGPTTDGHLCLLYEPRHIGDWGGHEEAVADWANERREEVLDRINRGRFPFRQEPKRWAEFANRAWNLIAEFDTYEAFTRLCEEWGNHNE